MTEEKNNEHEVKVEINKTQEEEKDNIEESSSDKSIDEVDTAQTEDEIEDEGEKSVEEIAEEYEAKIKELDDRYLRLAAEFDNFKKRTARQYQDIVKSSNEALLTQMLEVIDNFERALAAADTSSDFESLKSGTKLIYQNMMDILKKQGVEPIESVGKEFDPNLHEAMMQVESDEHPEGVVVQEMNRGYKLNDRVLRFARVVVSKGKEEEEPQE